MINEKLSITSLTHNNEIEEIISSKLPPIVKWGTVYFLILLLAIVTPCWFIRYPEIINAKARLVSVHKPEEIAVKTAGNLVSSLSNQYYAELYIPQASFDKVKTGQQVQLKFSAYPFQEYGSVQGKIAFISSINTDSGYLAKVILPQGLYTNYKKQIQFRNGLIAQGEIIIHNARLLEKILKL